jgi:RNA polymerase sigma factor for flagellar operon FliA
MDWIPRTLRQKQKKMDLALTKIEQETGRTATETEVAAEIGISEEDFFHGKVRLILQISFL